MLCWQPWGYNALKSGTTELMHTGLESGFAANKGENAQISYTRSLFVASQEFVRKNPVATRRMMQVLLRAQRYVADPKNRDEVVTLFVRGDQAGPRARRRDLGQYTFDPTFDERYVRDMERLTEYLVASRPAQVAEAPARVHVHGRGRGGRPGAGEDAGPLQALG